jgi:hypothetical protein
MQTELHANFNRGLLHHLQGIMAEQAEHHLQGSQVIIYFKLY